MWVIFWEFSFFTGFPETDERKNEKKLKNGRGREWVDLEENCPEKTYARFSPYVACIFQISLKGSKYKPKNKEFWNNKWKKNTNPRFLSRAEVLWLVGVI